MPRYAITEKAGRFVAGQNNNGAGTVLTLSEKQAEHEVRLGTLVAVDTAKAAQGEAGQAVDDPAAATPAKDEKAAPAPAPKAAKGAK